MNIFLLAIRGQNTAICHDPRTYTFKRGVPQQSETSTRHFTSTAPLFATKNLFDARLYQCKTNTRRIV
jgi:hypothetical protein